MPGQTGFNQTMIQDAYGHTVPLAGPALTAQGTATAAVIGGIVPNVAAAGTGGSVGFATGQTATDMAGTFTVTTSGTPVAGTVATVYFANPLPALPKAILCQMNDTDADQNESPLITGITVAGFSIVTALVLVAAEAYNVSYQVVL